MTNAVFVYGTLKRGQEREGCWPRAPRAVLRAKTRGRLHDLGPYPALIPGDDWVAGEVWQLAPEDVAETLRVLDEVECFGVDDVDLYVRREVECWTAADGQPLRAFVYFLADETEARRSPRVPLNAEGLAEWFPRG
ncbi:MAG: gamma-glutamylcyclotransferase family protein [Pirellulales bacterium]